MRKKNQELELQRQKALEEEQGRTIVQVMMIWLLIMHNFWFICHSERSIQEGRWGSRIAEEESREKGWEREEETRNWEAKTRGERAFRGWGKERIAREARSALPFMQSSLHLNFNGCLSILAVMDCCFDLFLAESAQAQNGHVESAKKKQKRSELMGISLTSLIAVLSIGELHSRAL